MRHARPSPMQAFDLKLRAALALVSANFRMMRADFGPMFIWLLAAHCIAAGGWAILAAALWRN